MLEYVVVAKHKSFVDYLKKQGWINEQTRVFERVGPADVAGKAVIGQIPIDIAAKAALVIVPRMDVPPEARNRDLTLEELEKYIKGFRTFMVKEVL